MLRNRGFWMERNAVSHAEKNADKISKHAKTAKTDGGR
jgi:hypothetical protein